MKTRIITNNIARSFVQTHEHFTANNIFAHWDDCRSPEGEFVGRVYIVYSYGLHYPMFIYDPATNQWYENADKYSPTTSKHRSQCRPVPDAIKLNTEQMQLVKKHGTAGLLLFGELLK